MRILISYAPTETTTLAYEIKDTLGKMNDISCALVTEQSSSTLNKLMPLMDGVIILISPAVHQFSENEDDLLVPLNLIHLALEQDKFIIPILAEQTYRPITLAMFDTFDFTQNIDINRQRFIDYLTTLAKANDNGQALNNIPFPYPPIAEILPPPFEFQLIPAGEVTLTELGGYLKEAETFEVERFAISKYPITNAQFAQFKPFDYAPDEADHPVVNVSWFDAAEFCYWLSKRVHQKVTLPTEQQWQRAAQGDTDWLYPWGNEADSTRCNVQESGIQSLSTVTQYPAGESPFGVMDMSGNVWEWCSTEWRTGSDAVKKTSNLRILRGGSGANPIEYAKITYRERHEPTMRADNRGFRIIQILED